MSTLNTGKAWVFGDDIDTDVLAPGLYMKGPLEELASHCLESVNPDFASTVSVGDVIIAGENFGIGSSREQAAQVLKLLGIRAIVAKSFGGIFFRNALNFGLIAAISSDGDHFQTGDLTSVDAATGAFTNLTQNEMWNCEPLPGELLEMVYAGGLVAHLEQRLAVERG